MPESVPLSSAPTLPPAKEIPSTFVASLRSWSAKKIGPCLEQHFDNFSRWAAGEKEAASSEERLLRYFFKGCHAFPLLLLMLPPGDCPSFEPGRRYRPAPLTALSLHTANRSRSQNLSIISTHSPSSPRLPPPKRRHRPSSCTATAPAWAFSS